MSTATYRCSSSYIITNFMTKKTTERTGPRLWKPSLEPSWDQDSSSLENRECGVELWGIDWPMSSGIWWTTADTCVPAARRETLALIRAMPNSTSLIWPITLATARRPSTPEHTVNRCPTTNDQLTLWRPLLPYGYSYKASCARPSSVTNDCLTQSGTGCFIAVPIWQQWALKG